MLSLVFSLGFYVSTWKTVRCYNCQNSNWRLNLKIIFFSSETSIKSANHFNTNETVSASLVEKFQNLSCSNYDRVLKKVTVIKEPNVHKKPFYGRPGSFVSAMGQYLSRLSVVETPQSPPTLGISIVQGNDGNVYVKDIVPNGPGDKSGITIGDQVKFWPRFVFRIFSNNFIQILAVNGTSLLSVPYEESIKILQKTANSCELIISQVVSAVPSRSKSISNLNESVRNPLSVHITRLELENNIQQPLLSPYQSPIEKYNFQQAEEVSNLNEEKRLEVRGMGKLKNFHDFPTLSLSPAKSLPEIPNLAKLSVAKKPALPRSLGLSRKYIGPVRYPVTPGKDANAPSKPLSLFGEPKQVFI